MHSPEVKRSKTDDRRRGIGQEMGSERLLLTAVCKHQNSDSLFLPEQTAHKADKSSLEDTSKQNKKER